MTSNQIIPLESLERWGPPSFLFGGAAWLVFVVVTVYEIYVLGSDGTYISLTGPLLLFGALGALIGLLAFYPRVNDRMPRIAGASAVLVGIGIVSWVVYTAGNLVEWYATGGGPFGETTTWPDFFFVLILIALLLGFLVFGLVSLWSRVPSRSVGVVMLLPSAALLLHVVTGNFIDVPDPILTEWAVMSVVMIVLWHQLSNDHGMGEQTDSTTDSTTP